MTAFPKITVAATLIASMFVLAACENTIRGAGRDAAETVDATQNAANRTGNAIAN